MPRRLGTKPIYYHLPEDHPALNAFDVYCEEWDKSRADASKDIMIAWARARQGESPCLSGLLGTTLGIVTGTSPVQATPTRSSKQDDLSLEKKGKLGRSPSRNAQSVDLVEGEIFETQRKRRGLR